jgi:hypothetical protein
MRPRPAQVVEDGAVGAAGVFERVGQDREEVGVEGAGGPVGDEQDGGMSNASRFGNAAAQRRGRFPLAPVESALSS